MAKKTPLEELKAYIELKYGPIKKPKKNPVAKSNTGNHKKDKKKGSPGDDPSFTK